MDSEKMKWWDKFCKIKRFSFIKNHKDAVSKMRDVSGAWIEQYEAGKLVEEMEEEINRLESENNALTRRLDILRNTFV